MSGTVIEFPGESWWTRLRRVREQATIVEIASQFTALRDHGKNNLIGFCPHRTNDEPSLVVHETAHHFYCFDCDEGGDAIKLVMHIKPMPFREAVEFIEDWHAFHDHHADMGHAIAKGEIDPEDVE